MRNQIAHKLDPSFQNKMRELFSENRSNLNLPKLSDVSDPDIGVLSGPVKTKARQQIKVKLDYSDKPYPQCMSVSLECGVWLVTGRELLSTVCGADINGLQSSGQKTLARKGASC